MSDLSQAGSAVAERFLLGFEGTSLPAELRRLLAHGLAGVAIYRRNWRSIEELRALTHAIRDAAWQPVLIGIDAEPGGKFSLPEPFSQWPMAAELGTLNDAGLLEYMARAMGRELRAAGVNLNFAPMLDLHVHPGSPVTSGRSFGGDPHKVSQAGAAVIRGLRNAGVLSCAKHYPGHGDALLDPHEDLPVFRGASQRLEAMELVPFEGAIATGVPLVMTAHILLPEIEPQWPASLSHKMLHETLREKMQFGGVILADDLGMGAIRKRYGIGQAAKHALEAGSDIVMVCHDWPAVQPAMAQVVEARKKGVFAENEWRRAAERIAGLRNALHAEESAGEASGPEVMGCAEHRALAAEIRSRLERDRR